MTPIELFYDALYSEIQSISSDTANIKRDQRLEDIKRLRAMIQRIIAAEVLGFFEKEPTRLDVSELPDAFEEDTRIAFIDLDLSQDLDITEWRPTGLANNALIQIRKSTTNVSKLSWKDPNTAQRYRFVDKQGEFLSLMYNKSLDNFQIF